MKAGAVVLNYCRKQEGSTGIFVLGMFMMFFTVSIAVMMFTFAQLSAVRSHLFSAVEAGIKAATVVEASAFGRDAAIKLHDDTGAAFYRIVAANLEVGADCLKSVGCTPPAGLLSGPVAARFQASGTVVEGTVRARYRLKLPFLEMLDLPLEQTYKSQPLRCLDRKRGSCS